ncbi:hypothetical protein [Christensenella tenuis]|jgi:hypothetical protein|uniref:Uncharacterized protein n=1 Tax=Christensenella tenuis TaxID=2763033 RepID=A0ABR7EDN0_9FIRM|nr:hypothetical protein [Christensenella tenuis]MBC5647263.1 hypothetical protein [Christensenella tenuis]
MKQLTEKQLNFWQKFLGIVAGIGIWLAIYFGSESDNILLQYLFLIIFVVVIFGQRKIERSLDMRLTLFTKFWLIGLVIGLGLFFLVGALTGRIFS